MTIPPPGAAACAQQAHQEPTQLPAGMPHDLAAQHSEAARRGRAGRHDRRRCHATGGRSHSHAARHQPHPHPPPGGHSSHWAPVHTPQNGVRAMTCLRHLRRSGAQCPLLTRAAATVAARTTAVGEEVEEVVGLRSLQTRARTQGCCGYAASSSGASGAPRVCRRPCRHAQTQSTPTAGECRSASSLPATGQRT